MTAYGTMDLIDLEIRLVDSIHGLDCHRDRGFRLINSPVTIPPAGVIVETMMRPSVESITETDHAMILSTKYKRDGE